MDSFLQENNLNYLVTVFKEENVTLDILLSSTEADVDSLLSALVAKLGDRLKLKNLVKNQRVQSCDLDNSRASEASTVLYEIDKSVIVSAVDVSPDDKSCLDLNNNISSSSTSHTSSVPIGIDVIDLPHCEIGQITESPSENNCTNPPPSKKHKYNYFRNFDSIESFLSSKLLGKALLKKCPLALSNTDKRTLVRLIVDQLLEDNKSVSASTLKDIADEIHELFPLEDPKIYFGNFFNGKRNVVCGKLIDRYRNQKHYLRSYFSPTNNMNDVDETPTVAAGVNDINNDNETLNDKLIFLKFCSEPWQKVLTYWKDTYEHRYSMNYSPSSQQTLVQSFPILINPKGHELVSATLEFSTL